jgi:hypothetical protein
MSESKISCPNCGQHLLLDDAWAGRTINCPACQQAMAIPALAAPVAAPPPPMRLSTPSAPPPPPAPRPGAAPRPIAPAGASPRATQTSGLAITSFVLSLLGCFFLTAIAGVICGHIARKRIRTNPSLKGGGLALAGVIIGYCMIALSAGYVSFVTYNVVKVVKSEPFQKGYNDARARAEAIQAQQQGQPMPGGAPQQPGVTFGSPEEKKPLPVPAGAVAGKIKGQTFTYSRASLDKRMGLFSVRDGQDFFADREVKIFLFPKPGESLENRTWKITAGSSGMNPHVHLSWQENGAPRTEIVTSGYNLELKTEAAKDGAVAGTFSLKVTGRTPVDLKGNFNAAVE